MIYKNIYETIGKTPVLEFEKNLYGKLEYFNPAGSVKDRIALSMIEAMIDELEEDLLTNKEINIVEPTSGNTGIAIAMICASKGLKSVMVMPETMSVERRKLIEAYGSKIVLTDGALGMSGAIEKARELCKEDNYIMLSQFENRFNYIAHENTTSLEIIEDFKDIGLDYLVCGIGTGGTITGTSRILKEYFKDIKIIGVEPINSPFLTQGTKGKHKIQGIGAGFKPDILNLDYIDEIRTIKDEEAMEYARKSAVEKGVLIGISSGAVYKVASDILLELENKNILFIAPDNGERYLSTELYM